MITVLQRQQVSKRDASPVNLRTRAEGVRWTVGMPRRGQEKQGGQEPQGSADAAVPFRISPPRSLLRYQPLRKLHPPKSHPPGVHSFLERQLIPVRRHNGVMRAPVRSVVEQAQSASRFERRQARRAGALRARTARSTVRA
jgi:hypothetical protein